MRCRASCAHLWDSYWCINHGMSIDVNERHAAQHTRQDTATTVTVWHGDGYPHDSISLQILQHLYNRGSNTVQQQEERGQTRAQPISLQNSFQYLYSNVQQYLVVCSTFHQLIV